MSDSKCRLCGTDLESRGDCSNVDCDTRRYNIPVDLLEVAASKSGLLVPYATGGNMDYIARFLNWNQRDSSPYLLLKAKGDGGSPEGLADACEVVLVLMEGGEQSISFIFEEASHGMDWMTSFADVDCSNYKGGRI
jgi:hypothetical protein